ncbi:MAG: hypothetical protein ACI85U_003473 [Candidatus Promineifilaceae bacterium]|jgi:hypothetical protein
MKHYSVTTIVILLGLIFVNKSTHAGAGGWIINNGYFTITQVCRDGYTFSRASSALGAGNYNAVKLFVSPANGILTHPIEDGWLDDNSVVLSGELVLAPNYHPFLGPTAHISDDQIIEVQDFDILGNTADKYLAQDVAGYFYEQLEVGDQVRFYKFILPVEDCYLATVNGEAKTNINKERLNATHTGIPENNLIYTVLELPTNGLANGKASLSIGNQLLFSEIAEAGLSYAPGIKIPNAVEHFHYSVQGTTRVSINSNSEQSFGGDSFEPSISANGSKIAFTTEATNLSSAVFDDNGVSDVILRNQLANNTTFISPRGPGNAGDSGPSYSPQISPDGGQIAFVSAGEHLLTNEPICDRKADNNNVTDIYLNRSGAITRASMLKSQVSSCEQLSQNSLQPSIADTVYSSKKVVFQTATPLNIVDFTDDNIAADLLLNIDNGSDSQLVYGISELGFSSKRSQATAINSARMVTLSAPNGANISPHISADGNVVAFQSDATDLIKSISGKNIDTNGVTDIYASEWNGVKWAVSRISVTSSGAQAIGGGSTHPSASQLGNHIVFESTATNLDARTNGQTQVYIRDREAGCTTLLSVNSSGDVGARHSKNASISANGRFVVFESASTNLISRDTNLASDIFVVDRDTDEDNAFYSDSENCIAGPSRIFRVSVASDGTQANGASTEPDISDNGAFVAFTSEATNLVSDDTNGYKDVFVHYIGFEGKIRFETNVPPVIFLPLVVR